MIADGLAVNDRSKRAAEIVHIITLVPLLDHEVVADPPDSFAFVATGQAYVKSEAALRIARELPRWQWTWVFHFIPRVIRDAIYDLVARNRYRWFGRRDACILPNSDRSWPW
jgi:predicted DCC family thiol-disulfide oxidoreductase YuxK